MGLFDYFFDEELTGQEKMILIVKRAKIIHAKKKGRKTRKVWLASLDQAKTALQKENKI